MKLRQLDQVATLVKRPPRCRSPTSVAVLGQDFQGVPAANRVAMVVDERGKMVAACNVDYEELEGDSAFEDDQNVEDER